MRRRFAAAAGGVVLLLSGSACVPIARPGSWQTEGLLATIAEPESIVALPGGRAFEIGGGQGAVFDPATRAWRATKPPPDSLVAPTVLTLHDGTVLVFGGRRAGVAVADSFTYDPHSDTWDRSGPMSVPRDGQAATVLNDGRVLTVGGVGPGRDGLASAELYDPALRRWTPTGAMKAPRYAPAAALAGDGRVIVINGFRNYDPSSRFRGDFPINDVEAFDPRVGRWSELPKLPLDLIQVRLVSLRDGRVAGLGGIDPQPYSLSAVQVFDPATNRWQQVSPMKSSQGSVQATVLEDGRIVVMRRGLPTFAEGAREITAGGEVYDPDTDLWLPITVRPGLVVLKFTRLSDGRVLGVGLRSEPGPSDAGESGYTTVTWDPTGYPQLPGSEGPLASGSLAATVAGVAGLLLLALGGARLGRINWRRPRP